MSTTPNPKKCRRRNLSQQRPFTVFDPSRNLSLTSDTLSWPTFTENRTTRPARRRGMRPGPGLPSRHPSPGTRCARPTARVAAALAGARAGAEGLRAGRDVAPLGAGTPAHPPARRHLQRLRRSTRPRAAVAARSGAGAAVSRGMDDAGGGPRAAGDAARSAAGRSLRPAADDRRGDRPARRLSGTPEPPARLRRAGAARGPLPALLRRRSGAHARRHVARDGRPHAGAGRGGLRAGEPDRARARAAGGLPRLERPAAGAVLPHAARDAGRAGASRRLEPAHRAAHRGAAQRDLLRAGVFGPVPRLSTGRGGRSDGARRPGLS